jgi:hypothetical protein
VRSIAGAGDRLLLGGLGGANDGRSRLRVNAVSLTDLNIGQPSVSECSSELSAGERSGNAAGVCLHVGAGGLVHALVGNHVRDGEALPYLLTNIAGVVWSAQPCG